MRHPVGREKITDSIVSSIQTRIVKVMIHSAKSNKIIQIDN